MTNDSQLNVFYENQLVGQLWHNTAGIMGFKYDDNWIKSGFAISQKMPLSIEEYSPDEDTAHKFFTNLLPEGNARIHIIRDYKIPNSDFELLKAIGGECAGAFSILPPPDRPILTADYKIITDDELLSMLKRKRMVYKFNSEKNRPRLSLAGAQDKCPVLYDSKDYFWPINNSPSSHIIKFEITDYKNIPAYEYCLTKLAKAIGLPVVDSELLNKDNIFYLLIKRYDREKTSQKTIKRLHQEDFCQALGVGYEKKYQQHGGPSFQDCFNLVQNVTTRPLRDTENLLRWQIFNVLAGNSDGHAKNLSLLYDNAQNVNLAPFYDLVCTRAVKDIDTHLAMSIGNQYDPGHITSDDWRQFSQQCNIRFSLIHDIILDMIERIKATIPTIIEEFEDTIRPYPALQRVQIIVTKQCKKTLSCLKD